MKGGEPTVGTTFGTRSRILLRDPPEHQRGVPTGQPASAEIPCWAAAHNGLLHAIDQASDHVDHELRPIMMHHVSAALSDHELGVLRQTHPVG